MNTLKLEEKKKNNDMEYFILIMIILGITYTILNEYIKIKKEKEQ